MKLKVKVEFELPITPEEKEQLQKWNSKESKQLQLSLHDHIRGVLANELGINETQIKEVETEVVE